MKALTANRLIDGEVVWLDRASAWVETLAEAQVLEGAAAEAEAFELAAAAVAGRLIVDPYLIDMERVEGALQPVRLRERIRASGPTMRPDLGKQARPRSSAA
ncbi:DUF2849 domain-containing protein [Stappia taiwanensis]|uniref:DUF2849 domain-containing protein n=1 Tax=Stappia taiwanensis TaxID=992267 RepID=A0A838XRA5_9HYPH|nr:DUF2849 domain-containing protein [Stappia taiwanensis]MBA4613789.1 DUF2849 domain-containing protein [Stappia taiwanensis]GGE90817.1 hypothetical protein GCM10007285_17930 [Stappia taiwanensis]